jgi:glycosyltransferase involved in cell wall biosynthesis
MRILHINPPARPVGGTETYIASLMRAQMDRGDEVALAHTDSATELGDDLAYISLPSGSREALDPIERWDPELVHIHGDALSVEVEARVEDRCAVVRSHHNISFVCAAGTHYFRDGTICTRAHGPGCLANLVLKGCAHRVDLRVPVSQHRRNNRQLPLFRSAAANVVYSAYVKSLAVQNGLPAERCHVIPYFVERLAEPPSQAPRPNIAFVGRVARYKGLDLLLTALEQTSASWDRLFVVGDGWDVDYCMRLAERLAIADHVDFLGWRDPTEVADVLAASRVVVVPSRWPEPFGIVGIEAMAQARPVIGSRVGGIPDWLAHRETGLLVAPGDANELADALDAVIGDSSAAQLMGEEGWRRVERFSVANHLEALDSVYHQAAATYTQV